MNKTYLTLAGTSVVSLAVGAGGAYLIVKKRFDAALDAAIDKEVEATKKYYSHKLLIQTEKARALEKKLEELWPGECATEEAQTEEDDTDEEEVEELSDADRKAIDKAKTALVNYQGYAFQEKPPLEQLAGEKVVSSNIFDASKKPAMPARDPSGKFVPKKTAEQLRPYLIEHEDFLVNDSENEQENLLWFVNDQTLIRVFDQEPVDMELIGAENLAKFPPPHRDEPRIICVRNDGLKQDYEIQLTEESLTEYMGFGESDDDDDDPEQV